MCNHQFINQASMAAYKEILWDSQFAKRFSCVSIENNNKLLLEK